MIKRTLVSQPLESTKTQPLPFQRAEEIGSRKSGRSLFSNVALLLLSTALLSWSIRLIQSQLTTISSVDAVVNGTLTDIRAPQEGIISKVAIKTGQSLSSEKELFVLKDRRASQLQTQEISSRLNQQEAELEQAQARLPRKMLLLNVVSREAVNQQKLAVSENQQSQNQLLSDIEGAKSRCELAKLSYQRTKFLNSQGAISRANLDTAEIELKQRKSEVKSLQAKLATLQVNEDAVRGGLSLSRTRSNYDPSIRLEELQLQIAEERQGIQIFKRKIAGTKAELSQAKKDFQRKQGATIKAPAAGVVWRVTAQPGKFVQQGESLGQVASCKQRWVDAWVDEQKVQLLQVGSPAEIKLNGMGSSGTLKGKVSVIRSGIGRLAAGEDVAISMPPNLPRQTQVRIDLDAGSVSSEPSESGNLCRIGYTARVTFPVRTTSLFAGL
ncbi:HlyD family efflux transporter periplasmic adaptor subunit [Chamaesiphon sp. OTE_20_metabat_361]|uniref:HlyD family secretion protein n=1 Tax=Chamaesiphon sp. OTE_20_metabat_361 TaxID=2964689 RepID=UPI00286ACA8D|nr:HlyD family efflux transporter periplasmic adaptor subunit [Chamaesiphon sp. OTE_20_metabat_361]